MECMHCGRESWYVLDYLEFDIEGRVEGYVCRDCQEMVIEGLKEGVSHER